MAVKLMIKGMGNEDSTITIKQLLAAEEVIAEFKTVQILSFRASLRDRGEIFEFFSFGTKFSENHRKQFKRLRAKSDIYFDNIWAKNVQGFIVCLKPVFYRIVE